MSNAQKLTEAYEQRPDPQQLTGNDEGDVDYEPHPDRSLNVSPEHKNIVQCITNLYSGSASEEDMRVYSEKAIYDDPWSYCDTRYKIAGQWYGIPKVMASSQTLATEIIQDSPTSIIFKLRQEYKPKVLQISKPVNSLVTLTLDDEGKVRYHKDMWNRKDYSHEGLGKVFKTLNGDYLTGITKPPDSL
ncbi:MAG: hypothetical protein M1822_009017 [Bathelium mastoideum]|nr:MAG: hypothetical protein M1822_009017 [Bathelium mastoideum]